MEGDSDPKPTVLVPKVVRDLVKSFEVLEYEDLQYLLRDWGQEHYMVAGVFAGKSKAEREEMANTPEWREMFLEINKDPRYAMLMAMIYLSDEKLKMMMDVLKEKFEKS